MKRLAFYSLLTVATSACGPEEPANGSLVTISLPAAVKHPQTIRRGELTADFDLVARATKEVILLGEPLVVTGTTAESTVVVPVGSYEITARLRVTEPFAEISGAVDVIENGVGDVQWPEGYTDLQVDSDGDGKTDLEELSTGTDPTTGCGNGVVETDAGEECDGGDADTADCDYDDGKSAHACTRANCGDGYVNIAAGESCDDGDQSNSDSCPDGTDGTCQPAMCGDGHVWNADGGGEGCDDGNQDNSDRCPDGQGGTCHPSICGDGHVWNTDGGLEECDSLSVDTSTCDYDSGTGLEACTLSDCGDGYLNTAAGESCDDGDVLDNGEGECLANCSGLQVCGDGVAQGTESCDDGYTDACGTCNSDCSAAGSGMGTCGDGTYCPEAGEVCDDGYTDACGTCNADCSAAGTGMGTCGDGTYCPEAGEACDDGYTDACGTCNADCSAAGTGMGTCGDATYCPEASEACDDGYTDACGTCNADCSAAGSGLGTCGDGTHCPEAGEACDDGYTDACGTCNADCSGAGTGPGTCGDGTHCPEAGESCDDGNAVDCVGECSSDCSEPLTITGCGDGIICGAEQCDDGGESAACDIDCTAVACGDGIRNATANEDVSCEPWVVIPQGFFMMGSTAYPDSQPIHEVAVPAFEMMATEVTVADYNACVDAGDCTAPDTGTYCNWSVAGREDHPVNCVDWYQSDAYCTWAGGRLPSEAEWEYAARSGGQDITYPWGDETATCDFAVMNDGGSGCGLNHTWPVCNKPAGDSVHGLCDMAGNVWEWGQDWYHSSYDGAPADGSAWEAGGGTYRVMRGGTWQSGAGDLRAAYRTDGFVPSTRYHGLGFRCARPPS